MLRRAQRARAGACRSLPQCAQQRVGERGGAREWRYIRTAHFFICHADGGAYALRYRPTTVIRRFMTLDEPRHVRAGQ